MIQCTRWVVTQEESGTKLLAFLKSKLESGYSARQLKKAIESNLCQVNRKTERFATAVLGSGDVVDFSIDEVNALVHSPLKFERDRILFEDDDFLIYDKPARIASEEKELTHLLHSYHSHLELVHRLDRNTTGVVIFAKNHSIRNTMIDLFKKAGVKKEYLAIVDGVPEIESEIIENYLGKLHSYEGQALWGAVPKSKGLYAKTTWHCLKKGKVAALIQCFPETGRTHQIRVHLNGIGHPILGDYQYGRKFRCAYRLKRFLLHAREISFLHPKTGLLLRVSAPIPEDFQEALQALMR